jgi:putative NADH-flavin reductase
MEFAMRLFVLGATGGIGKLVLQQAVARGHCLTAFVRSPGKVTLRNERLAVQKGNVLDANDLARHLPGHDAVISALGSHPNHDPTLLRDSAAAIVEAMRQCSVRRFLVVSVAFLFPESGVAGAFLRSFLQKRRGQDAKRMEEILQNSGLDWTVVRPPRLTNSTRTGSYRVADGRLPEKGWKIPRADVADFLLNDAEKPAHVHQIVGVAL